MSLAIVIPVFNEEKNIKKLIKDWRSAVRKNYKKKYKFIIVNDGSTDKTHQILKSINKKNIVYILQKNSGHGNACLKGYKLALKKNFEIIMQIDSDNQCDPIYFEKFLNLIKDNDAVFGNRVSREDGFLRIIFSRILSILIYLKTMILIKDPNVPYRAIKSKVLKSIIYKIPKKIDLKNCYLSYLLEKNYKVEWIKINFRKRYYGETKYKFNHMGKLVFNLMYYI